MLRNEFQTNDCIKIDVGIDRILITGSSIAQFWPILEKIYAFEEVFLIGVFRQNKTILSG